METDPSLSRTCHIRYGAWAFVTSNEAVSPYCIWDQLLIYSVYSTFPILVVINGCVAFSLRHLGFSPGLCVWQYFWKWHLVCSMWKSISRLKWNTCKYSCRYGSVALSTMLPSKCKSVWCSCLCPNTCKMTNDFDITLSCIPVKC